MADRIPGREASLRCDVMLQVAIDAGPLHGARTGIGNAVAWTIDAIDAARAPDVELLPYVVSMRARTSGRQRRLPIPAAVAHRLWERSSVPPLDRLLGTPDVVHGTNYVVPPTRASRLVTVYDCWFLDHPADAHPDVIRAGRILERSIGEGAHVVTSSEATSDRVREMFSTDRVHTIPLGPPPPIAAMARQPARVHGGDPFVLSLGTVERRKNVPLLVSAFATVAGEHPTVRLVIAGRDGNDSEELERRIDALSPEIAARVVRLGAVSDGVKRWLLENAAVLAYPSLDEGFGFPILEAQQAGTPVVASAAGSIPEVAGSAALLCLASDPTALAVHLYAMLTDEDRRATIVERGRRNIERFAWSRTATSLIDLYRGLASAS